VTFFAVMLQIKMSAYLYTDINSTPSVVFQSVSILSEGNGCQIHFSAFRKETGPGRYVTYTALNRQTIGTWPAVTLWRTRTLNNIDSSRCLAHVAEACTDNILWILVLFKAVSFLRIIEGTVYIFTDASFATVYR
jgi:hypothetical protein